MRFTVSMKDPDTLQDAIEEAVTASIAPLGLSEPEREAVEEVRREKVGDLCGRWFECGEYLRVEVDTEAGTCVVLPVVR